MVGAEALSGVSLPSTIEFCTTVQRRAPGWGAGIEEGFVRFIRLVLQAALLGLLVACGGGGGDPSSNSTNSITLDVASVTLEGDHSSAYAPGNSRVVTATFRGAGVVVGIPPGQPALPAWLSVMAGAPMGNSVPFTISYWPYPGTSVGRYAYTLRFATGNLDGAGNVIQSSVVYRDLPVVLVIAPTVTPNMVSHTVAVGGAAATTQIGFSWGAQSWTARTSAPWITIDRTSGTPAQDGLVNVTVNPAGLAEGEYSGNVIIEETVGRAQKLVPVQMVVERPRLVARQRGVALSLVGSQERLSASLPMSDNLGTIGWQATSDQPWLQLTTSSGASGSTLAMTADAAALPDGMHHARITLTPRNGAVAEGTSVRVGLYVNRAHTPSATAWVTGRDWTTMPTPLALGFVADPIRPYIYKTLGDERVDLYNAHTTALESHIQVPGGLAALAVSADGSHLYLQHAGNGNLYALDLDSRVLAGPWAGARMTRNLAYTEVNGRAVLVSGELQVIDAQTGALLADADVADDQLDNGQSVAVRRDGRAAYFQSPYNGNHEVSRYVMSSHNGSFSFRRTHRFMESGDAKGIIVDSNDARVITSSAGAANAGEVYHPDTMAVTSSVGCCNGARLQAAPDGGFYGAGWDNVYRYAPGASTVGNSWSYPYTIADFVLSGHGSRLVMRGSGGGNEILYFQDVP